jgi:hypothetical protein
VIDRLTDFTYDSYVEFLGFLRRKYKITPFCEVTNTNAPFLILRHDVDASPDAALRMAEIERKLKIRSTYFVLFSNKLYNLLEKDSLCTLKRISRLGHEIGLHYDVETYESYGQPLEKSRNKEIQMLEHLLNKKISSVACHNVSLISKKDLIKETLGYLNAYDKRFFDLYVSDSCRAWYMKDLMNLLDFKTERVQLLIHPILWTEYPCDRKAVYERLFQVDEEQNRNYKSEWLELIRKNPKVRNYDKLVNQHKHERTRINPGIVHRLDAKRD